MKIHLKATGIDDVLVVGNDPDDDATPDEALGQIPDRPFEDLMPPILAAKDPTHRMIMMYHAALAYIDQNNLWLEPRVLFSVNDAEGTYRIGVEAE